jgi:hypothetical protein
MSLCEVAMVSWSLACWELLQSHHVWGEFQNLIPILLIASARVKGYGAFRLGSSPHFVRHWLESLSHTPLARDPTSVVRVLITVNTHNVGTQTCSRHSEGLYGKLVQGWIPLTIDNGQRDLQRPPSEP